jgi:CarD family transcriptional regulator
MHKIYGVLQIIGTEDMVFDGITSTYYVCKAVFGHEKGITIKIPVNRAELLNPLISKDEAKSIIDNIESYDMPWIPESKRRINKYEELLLGGEIKQLCAALKELYGHKDLIKFTNKDKEFVEKAEKIVFGEFAIALDIPYDNVKDYIGKRQN